MTVCRRHSFSDTTPITLVLFTSLDAFLSDPQPEPLPLPIRLAPPSPARPLSLHAGLSHFLLLSPPHLLALSDNRFSQCSSHLPPLPGLSPSIVEEVDGIECVAAAAGGKMSAAVSAAGEMWVWGEGAGEQTGRVEFVDEQGGEVEVEVRGVACGVEHVVCWTDCGVWVCGLSECACGQGSAGRHWLTG